MTRPGAFSGLKLTDQTTKPALDQRLFAPPPAMAPVPALETTKQRDNETTLSRAHGPTPAPMSEPTLERSNERVPERTSARSKRRGSVPTNDHARRASRALERHSHDIYQDQVRWLNRTKLDFEETYGVKVTGNAMVQVALDRLRRDFEAEGEASDLFRVLVLNEPLRSGEEEERR
ncbi:MAG: hypothetical protein AB7F99_01425 [Vicinamibacterales bacterium]